MAGGGFFEPQILWDASRLIMSCFEKVRFNGFKVSQSSSFLKPTDMSGLGIRQLVKKQKSRTWTVFWYANLLTRQFELENEPKCKDSIQSCCFWRAFEHRRGNLDQSRLSRATDRKQPKCVALHTIPGIEGPEADTATTANAATGWRSCGAWAGCAGLATAWSAAFAFAFFCTRYQSHKESKMNQSPFGWSSKRKMQSDKCERGKDKEERWKHRRWTERKSKDLHAHILLASSSHRAQK